jgi:tetratricopeptide (TPR) repeat protein
MRPRIAVLIACVLPACAHRPPPPVSPNAAAVARLASADAQLRAGCFDCLVSAYREYEALRATPLVSAAATDGAVQAAALAGVRERELGAEDGGYFERARDTARAAAGWAVPLDIADSLPVRGGGVRAVNPVIPDAELARMQAAYRNKDAWTSQLRARADHDALSAYLWVAYSCEYTPSAERALESWLADVPSWRDTPLVAFKAATCGGADRASLDGLLRADPRFVEINYFLGLAETLRGKLDLAIGHLQHAFDWRPRWPAVTTALANDYIALEEFDRATEFFDRTLAVVPQSADALLGKAKALTYAGHYDDALATLDSLLALQRWYVGDARYWRAWNELQLGRLDDAWDDVELAAKLLVNSDVPKLAGIIAYRRRQVDVAREKFELARERNGDDCEIGYYLGLVLAEQGTWARTTEVLVTTCACLDRAERALDDEIARIRARTDPSPRDERLIAKREQQIVAGRRMAATSRYDIAVAYYNLARTVDAREYAGTLVDDEQFGERARELLNRLPK